MTFLNKFRISISENRPAVRDTAEHLLAAQFTQSVEMSSCSIMFARHLGNIVFSNQAAKSLLSKHQQCFAQLTNKFDIASLHKQTLNQLLHP